MIEASHEGPPQPRRADQLPHSGIRFSICTLVTGHGEYAEMVESFRQGGFTGDDCEYLYLDNTQGNTFDAYRGYNLFLTAARGDYLILTHQDLLLLEDGRVELEARLAELDELDPAWALCGNAGGVSPREVAVRISDPHGEDRATGKFPARVLALDENFVVARRDANLPVSHDLHGFHIYAADMCILADVIGRTAYAIDFHLRHKSIGTIDTAFYAVRRDVIAKYRRAFRSRWIRTPCTIFLVSGLPLLGRFLSTKLGRPFRR